MSHHLDTPLAAQNGQLFIDDLYVSPARTERCSSWTLTPMSRGSTRSRASNRREAGLPTGGPLQVQGALRRRGLRGSHLPDLVRRSGPCRTAAPAAACADRRGRAGGLGGGAGAARRYRPDCRRLPASCSPTCCPTSWARRRRSASLAATAAPWPATPPRSCRLVTGAAVPSGLKPGVASAQRSGTFPYVIPA